MSRRLCCGPGRRSAQKLLNDIEEGKDGIEKPEGLVSWALLEVAFQPGTEVWYENHGQKIGGEVLEIWYDSGCAGEYFGMSIQSINSTGRDVTYTTKSKQIYKYLGNKPITDLPVQRMTETVKAELTNRGKLFRRYCVGQHYLTYHGIGFMDWPPQRDHAVQNEFGGLESGFQTFRSDGRVMVDCESFVRFNANYFQSSLPWWATRADKEEEQMSKSRSADFPDEELWKAWPTVKGFSFKAKRWGELAVEGLMPIHYRKDAIETLVMDEGRKEMVLALVEHAKSSFKDIVDEKGGGCVFLLHGPPGVGKTLTAEATAERLQRPLYSITVGELGSSVESMEARLKFTLELTRIWDAVLLIDECDIFLERRDTDVRRNAMTGIFLRLLEYHQGILFLTSNRIKHFDPALNSRITVALHYPALDHKTRSQVWRAMLIAAGENAASINCDILATDNANGRQIKNAVRFAQVMARRKHEPLCQEHCQLAAKLAREFHCEGDADDDGDAARAAL